MAVNNSLAKRNDGAASLNVAVNTLLDQQGMRKRFNELLGKRTPQFVSSLVSLLNATPQLKEAWISSPLTVIQSALKAATYDLPIDPALGFAYIVPFKAKGVPEAQFIMGYKGMVQLALRTGAYKTINVVDIREGELLGFNRLTEEADIAFVEDEETRDQLPIVGYMGYFKLVNGTEKTIYMTEFQIRSHEKSHRKGDRMGKGWRDDFEAMCRKTVLRKLIGSWGLMSIDYQKADDQTVAIAQAIATGTLDDEDTAPIGVIEQSQEPPQVDEQPTEELTNNDPFA